MKNKIIIQTDRLFLRKVVLNDSKYLVNLFSDPLAMTFFPKVLDLKGTIKWINKVKNCYKNDGFGFYVCEKRDNLEIIGYCGLLLQKKVGKNNEIEIGYGLIRRYWHQGFATEAAKGCMKYGINKFNIKRFISLIRPKNVASINVAKRVGMKWEKNIIRWNHIHCVYAINIDKT
jgi:RimJ/RimL family protein N-acetyltransferase